MLESIKTKREWISDKLIRYVGIVFGLVVGQSIARNSDLVLRPWEHPFALLTLIVVIITITYSWIGYHRSMYSYPYRAETLKRSIRLFNDFLIVVVYARLLFIVDDFRVAAGQINLFDFLFSYVVIFLLYVVDGKIRIWEVRDPAASRIDLSLYFASAYLILAFGYRFIYSKTSYPEVANYAAMLLCLAMYLGYRIWRERKNPAPLAIVVDIDGVLADQVTPVLENLNRKFGSDYKKDDIKLWDQPLPLAHTDIKTEIEKSHNDPDFILNMKPIEYASEVLRELSGYFKIIIATNRPDAADKPTKKWLKLNHIPYDTYINTSAMSKGSIEGIVLVDDYPGNIAAFSDTGRTAFIFSQPWNDSDQTLIGNKHIVRVQNWREVLDRIKTM